MNVGSNYKKGRKNELIKLLYLVKVIPYKSLSVIDPRPAMMRRVINDLVKEGIITIDKKGGEKNIRLINTRENKDKYEEYIPQDYVDEYDATINTFLSNLASTANSGMRAKKVLKDSASQLMMYSLGIPIGIQNPHIDYKRKDNTEKSYYLSADIKASEDLGKKNQSSRINGVLFSPGGVYCVYFIGNKLITWKQVDERKMAISVNLLARKNGLASKGNNKEFVNGAKECIVMATDMSQFVKICLLDYSKKNRAKAPTKLINIDYTYDSMYAIPADENGKNMLRIMTDSGWKEKIYSSLLTQEERSDMRTSSVTCDGYRKKDEVYIYVFCVPDLTRLKTFLNRAGLENNKKKFIIYCFSYQLPIISGIVDPNNVTVMQVDLNVYMQKHLNKEV